MQCVVLYLIVRASLDHDFRLVLWALLGFVILYRSMCGSWMILAVKQKR